MKKFIHYIKLCLCFSVIFSLLSCNNNNSIKIATGGTSGTYYGFSNVIAQTLNAALKDKLNLLVVSTGASKANIQLVDQGECAMAIVQNDVMYYAYNAKDMFEGNNPITSFSAIASCYPEAIQIISNKNINSIEDLRGKKVSVGDAGSGTEFNAKQILGVYGIDIDKDIKKNNQSFADSADSIKNGTIDAAFVVAGHPTVAITELATSTDFNILSIDDSHIRQLQNQYEFYTALTIPKDTYSVLDNDVKTVAVMATFIANNNLPEETVYEFTKGLYEQKDNFEHSKASLLDPNTGLSGISIPLHKGAEKYYSELGLK